MHSTQKLKKIAKRYIRTSKKKINKYMTLVSKMYIDKLDDMVNKYNNTN